ncbi:MAG: rhomboid family intramembrane serine protease [Akkermansiaceae bacterium]
MSSSIPNIDPLPKRPSPYWVRLRSYGIVIAVLWLIELLDSLLLGSRFEMWGIQPRDFSELEGIIFAPFLHAGWGHLLSNSIALLILGAALLMSGWRDLLILSVVSALVVGVIVWVIGESNSVHIGASSVVFGYFGFLIASVFYQKTPRTILLAVLVVIFFGGALWTMLPTKIVRTANISWEGHLGGAMGGFLVARSRRKKMVPAKLSSF